MTLKSFLSTCCRNPRNMFRPRSPSGVSSHQQTSLHCKRCRTYPCYLVGMFLAIVITGLCMELWQNHVWRSWQDYPMLREDAYCTGRFIGYDHKFALLKKVLVTPKECGRAATKEEMKLQMPWHPEYKQYIGHCQMTAGFFRINCHDTPSYSFIEKNGFISHLNLWIEAVTKLTDKVMIKSEFIYEQMFTIALPRYDYTNSFGNVVEFYNTFLVMDFFGKTAKDTNVLMIDTNPQGPFHSVWKTLFGKVTWISGLEKPTLYRNMVWGPQDYSSPMMQHEGETLPLVDKFRDFVLERYNIHDDHNLDCNNVHILFIWRRGNQDRQIKNEGELLDRIQREYPSFTLKGLDFSKLSMAHKLKTIAQTDILIGMHGADLTFSLFLPKHAGVIELYPKSWEKLKYQSLVDKYDRFEALGKWRETIYTPWENQDEDNELNGHTIIPPDIMVSLFEDTLSKICTGEDLVKNL